MEDKKDLQKELRETTSKVWLAGLGAMASARDEGSELFKTLVEKGERYEARGRETLGEVKDGVEGAVGKAKGQAGDAVDKLEDRLDTVVSGALKRFGVPSRDEIAILTKRVEELTTLVEQLKPVAKTPAKAAKPAAKAKSTAAKSTAAKSTAAKSTAAKSTAAN